MLKVLEQAEEIARRNWPRGKAWKVVVIIGLVIAAILGIVAFLVWVLATFVKAITAGGFRNQDLYMPRMGRKRR